MSAAFSVLCRPREPPQADLPYLCARIWARTRDLLPNESLERFRGLSQLSDLFHALLETPCASALKQSVLDTNDLDELETGLTAVYAGRVAEVRRLVEQSVPEYLYLIVGEWDMHHVRALVRWVLCRWDAEAVRQAFLPVGTFTRERYDQAMAADTLPDLFRRLEAWLPELTAELRSFAERPQKEEMALWPWELFLDELHFRRMLRCAQHARNRADAEIIRRCTTLRIDLANLRTSLRLLGRRLAADEVQSLYLSGGSIPWKSFAAMMRADAIEQIHRRLPRGPLTAALDLGLLSLVNTGWPAVFERLFDEQRIRLKKTLARGYPVSVAVPLYFMARAYNELVNLRTIARGIRYRIPAGKVRENLVYA